MSKAEKTKRCITEKAALLFNTKGYRATSLSDIVEVTGLTKGSIYGNFDNKDEVAVAAFHYSITRLNERLSMAVDHQTSASDKLFAFTGYYRTNWNRISEQGGCPILNAAIEADDNLDFLKRDVQISIKNWVKDISETIEQGQENGEFKKDINAQKYAYTLLTILEGGIMLFKIMNTPELLFSALDRMETIIEQELKA